MDSSFPLPDRQRSGVAIIGMAGRFPGAPTVQALWQLLLAGDVPLHTLTDEALQARPDAATLAHRDYVRSSFVLADIDLFDAGFFGYSPREASLLDPQHRLFLQTAWHALEDAGYVPSKTEARIGVFASANFNTYAQLSPHWPGLGEPERYLDRVLAADKDYLAGRCAYKFDLRGPVLSVQTACSSSLTAVALACNELLTHGCDMALAGGVGVTAYQRTGYLWSEGSPLARGGRCLPFDAEASGMIDSSGVGAVLLKRLEDALADGDTVYAVIAGSGLSNDGARKSSFTAPGVDGQVEAIRAALAMAEVDAHAIGYVETHGTGTPMGDPVETAALHQALGREGEPCVLGALKANIGHMGAAAGIGGLIKAALVLQHGVIPAHPTFQRANPECQLQGSRLQVNTRPQPWTGAQRHAGVSSFGLGGSNVHLVLRAAPSLPPAPSREAHDVLLGLSAHTETALQAAREQLLAVLEQPQRGTLAAIAHTLAVGREDHELRLAVCGDTRDALREALLTAPITRVQREARVVFVFPGAGAQHPGMGGALYQSNPRVRAAIDRIAELALAQGGSDPRQVILADPDYPMPEQAHAVLIALFAVEWALATELQYLGVTPDGLLGHSLGEYVAATLAGVFDLATAVSIILKRAELLDQTQAGGMLAMPVSARTQAQLSALGLSLAALNGPQQAVVSGPLAAIEHLHGALVEEGVAVARLPVARAGHSALLEPILPAFAEFLQGCRLQPARQRFISNRSGDWADAQAVATAAYWVQHLRDTVQFSRGLGTLLADGPVLLVEIGPGRGLSALARRHPSLCNNSLILPSAGGETGAWRSLLCTLWACGAAPKLAQRLLGDGPQQRISLPGYAFDGQSYWQEAPQASAPASGEPWVNQPEDQWRVHPLWLQQPLPQAASLQGQRHLLLGPGSSFSDGLQASLQAAGAEVEQARTFSPALGASHVWCIWPLYIEARRPTHSAVDDYLQIAQPAFEQLLATVREMALNAEGPLPHLTLLTSGLAQVLGDETLTPELAGLPALLRTVPHELPASLCRSVDLDGLRGQNLAATFTALTRLVAGPAPQTPLQQQFAIRNGRLWHQVFQPAPAWTPQPIDACAVRAGGGYLVLGGTGGIGQTLTRALAQQGAAYVCVLGRSTLQGERLQQWQGFCAELAALGTEVALIQADMGEPQALLAAVKSGLQKMPRLNGVIHAAGVVGAGLIQAELPSGAQSNVGPKILGLLALEPVLREFELDFVLLCSSLGARFGAAGQVDNVLANSFFDSYASAGRLPRCRQVLSIGWDYWREVGMIKTLETRHREFTGEDISHGMTPQQGADWCLRLLGGDSSQVLLSTLPMSLIQRELEQRLGQAMGQFAALDTHARQGRPRGLTCAPVAPVGAVEQLLCLLWGERLGLETVGTADNYLELGGDSLMALALLASIREALATDIAVRALYQHPTVAGLATWLLSHADPQALHTRAALYLEVRHMTADAVSRALHDSSKEL